HYPDLRYTDASRVQTGEMPVWHRINHDLRIFLLTSDGRPVVRGSSPAFRRCPC
ncbi:hypothetical protein HAX54_052684, partial [Datura stramonium]|nr:hypothetical protein [Datura stramonium]